MVTTPNRPDDRNANQLQGVDVPGVPGKEKASLRNDSGLWTINVRTFRVHNTHVEDGQRRSAKCGICRKDLGSLTKGVESELSGDELAQSRRDDKERAESLARDNHRHGGESEQLW